MLAHLNLNLIFLWNLEIYFYCFTISTIEIFFLYFIKCLILYITIVISAAIFKLPHMYSIPTPVFSEASLIQLLSIKLFYCMNLFSIVFLTLQTNCHWNTHDHWFIQFKVWFFFQILSRENVFIYILNLYIVQPK